MWRGIMLGLMSCLIWRTDAWAISGSEYLTLSAENQTAYVIGLREGYLTGLAIGVPPGSPRLVEYERCMGGHSIVALQADFNSYLAAHPDYLSQVAGAVFLSSVYAACGLPLPPAPGTGDAAVK